MLQITFNSTTLIQEVLLHVVLLAQSRNRIFYSQLTREEGMVQGPRILLH